MKQPWPALGCCARNKQMHAINVEETTTMSLKEPSPVQFITYQKQMENVEYFNYLGSMMQAIVLN